MKYSTAKVSRLYLEMGDYFTIASRKSYLYADTFINGDYVLIRTQE